jgi:hypothetical protein
MTTNSETIVNSLDNPIKHKTNRCGSCNKKLGVDPIVCKCQGMFCDGHRLPFNDNCSFDFRAKSRNELDKTLSAGKTIVEKIIRI